MIADPAGVPPAMCTRLDFPMAAAEVTACVFLMADAPVLFCGRLRAWTGWRSWQGPYGMLFQGEQVINWSRDEHEHLAIR